MTEDPTINAMIPARIGSQRFKMKNLAMLDGKPMIAYAITAALESKVFSRVIVNSDSDKFSRVANKFGAEFYQRPNYLGESTIQSDDVVRDFVETFPSDIVVWLNPIAPLQTIEDIQNTINHFVVNNVDSLFTVRQEQMQCVFRNQPVNFDSQGKFSLTQDLEPIYPFSPFIMMWRTRSFLESMDMKGYGFFSGKVDYYPISRLSSITVKYEEDFRLAELMLQLMRGKNSPVEYYKDEE